MRVDSKFTCLQLSLGMLVMRPILLVIVGIFGLVSTVTADPGSHTRWLMTEPLSLFDMGIYRATSLIEEELERYQEETNKKLDRALILSVHSDVGYDWEKDLVELEWQLYVHTEAITGPESDGKRLDSTEKFAAFCGISLFHLQKRTFGQIDTWGKSRKYDVNTVFGHHGFAPESMPEDLYRDFSKRILYSVIVNQKTEPNSGNTKKVDPVKCTIAFDSPFGTTTPTFIDYYKELEQRIKGNK